MRLSLPWEVKGLQTPGACSFTLRFNDLAHVGGSIHMGMNIHGVLYSVAGTWKELNECLSQTVGNLGLQ